MRSGFTGPHNGVPGQLNLGPAHRRTAPSIIASDRSVLRTSQHLSSRVRSLATMAQGGGQKQSTPLTAEQEFELEKLRENHKAAQLLRWDQMHICLAALVITVVTFFIGVFALRGDVQGMSSAAAIGSGWVGAVLGWFFTKYSGTASTAPTPSPGAGGGGPAPPPGGRGGPAPPNP